MKKAFTLAEVLITLSVIGVVAAMTIPSVIVTTSQSEYRTGLRKAVSVLNDAIQTGIQGGLSPYDLDEKYTLFEYLRDNMLTIKTTSDLSAYYYIKRENSGTIMQNKVFYTVDGMRFEFINDETAEGIGRHKTYETGEDLNVSYINFSEPEENREPTSQGWKCGSLGLGSNNEETRTAPCLITVDVNGDKKPNPQNANCRSEDCATTYKFSSPTGKILTDTFSIIITEKTAIPYGTAAQKAMYAGGKRSDL